MTYGELMGQSPINQNLFKDFIFHIKMARSSERSKRKVTGGRYQGYRKKRLHSLASNPTSTKLQEKTVRVKRAQGGHLKFTLLTANVANVFNPKTKKSQKTEITNVVENPANRHFVRRNIITKGTIVETKLGKVRITSRPGQEGSLNAVLL